MSNVNVSQFHPRQRVFQAGSVTDKRDARVSIIDFIKQIAESRESIKRDVH